MSIVESIKRMFVKENNSLTSVSVPKKINHLENLLEEKNNCYNNNLFNINKCFNEIKDDLRNSSTTLSICGDNICIKDFYTGLDENSFKIEIKNVKIVVSKSYDCKDLYVNDGSNRNFIELLTIINKEGRRRPSLSKENIFLPFNGKKVEESFNNTVVYKSIFNSLVNNISL